MTTFIELVNTAIDESKVSLDPLTPLNFDDPPRTAMYQRMKRWVNDAYKELLTTRNEWFTRKERALVTVYPRVHITNAIVPPVIGYVYRGRVSEVEFTVRQIHQDELIEGGSPDDYTLSVEFNEDDQSMYTFAKGEDLDIISPAPTVRAARYKGIGFYNLAALADNAELIDKTTLQFFPTVADYEEEATWEQLPITNVTWSDLIRYKQGVQITNECGPWYVSQTPLGTYSFWPLLRRPKLLEFYYTRAISDMTTYDSEPIGIPEQYQNWIVWRAVKEFGDFQQNTSIWSRGNKNAEVYMSNMERDNAPEIKMGVTWQ